MNESITAAKIVYFTTVKKSPFHVQQPTFLFHLETLSRDMLHEWKDNPMLAKSLAAYTYLCSIISELYDA